MIAVQNPFNVSISPSIAGLTFAGRNGAATRITITNNDTRNISEVRINALRADLMPSGVMSEATIVKDGAGETVITDKWMQAKLSTDSVYTAIDDWNNALTFSLDAGISKSFDVKLVIPDAINAQGKISFSLLISFKAVDVLNVTGISIDGVPLANIGLSDLPLTTLSATVTADVGADTTVTWQSSDDSIFTVDSAGIVTPVGVGRAIIRALSTNPRVHSSAFLTIQT